MSRVRQATTADVDALVELFRDYRAFYDRPSRRPALRAFLLERLERGEATVHLATHERDAHALGFALTYPTYSSLALRPAVVLNDLYVVPDARQSGIGRALVAAVVRDARRARAAYVSLETARTNARARRLYEAVGFERDAVFDRYVHSLGR